MLRLYQSDLLIAGGVDMGYFNGRAPAILQEVAGSIPVASHFFDWRSKTPRRWFPGRIFSNGHVAHRFRP
jgi:hypothetical protein